MTKSSRGYICLYICLYIYPLLDRYICLEFQKGGLKWGYKNKFDSCQDIVGG